MRSKPDCLGMHTAGDKPFPVAGNSGTNECSPCRGGKGITLLRFGICGQEGDVMTVTNRQDDMLQHAADPSGDEEDNCPVLSL